MQRPPRGLGASGRQLWRDVHADYGLAPHERAILIQACRCLDRLDAIETALAGADLITEGSMGQVVVHPLLPELRAQARLLEALSRALCIPLPNEEVGRRRSPSARDNALARWGTNGVA